MAVAMLIGTSVFAQQKIAIEPNTVGPDAARALTIISRPGSYVLNRNIVNARAGVDSVHVTASNVTIDLQGFAIMSTNSSTGVGINSSGVSNVIIRDGTISGQGGAGISAGNTTSISDLVVSGNGGSGISCGAGCLISNNVVQGNAGAGMIFLDNTTGYLANVVQGNDSNTSGTTGQVSGGTSLGQNLCNGTTC
jgi:hypothetical protein